MGRILSLRNGHRSPLLNPALSYGSAFVLGIAAAVFVGWPMQ